MKKILIIALAATFGSFQTEHARHSTIYAHGIVDGPTQIDRFDPAIATDHRKAVAFTDTLSETGWGPNGWTSTISTRFGKPVNRSKMCMGQAQDIDTIKEAIDEHPSDQVILYGCSRGAATLINYMALYNPDNVQALVLDAPPANMPGSLHAALAKIGLHKSWDETLFNKLFPAYPCNSVIPVNAIKDIKNKALPILLVHSKTDSKVAFVNSLRLYREFKQQGFNNVHLAAMPSGRHSFLLQDPEVRDKYLRAVHSFYKSYSLPHNEAYATADIKDYAYNLDQATQEIQSYEQMLEEQYNYSKTRNEVATGATALLAFLVALYKYL